MFCHNCGKKLDEQVKHCPYCGAKQLMPGENSGKRKGSPKGRLFFLAAVVVAAVLIFAAGRLLLGGQKLKVTDYIRVEVMGLNGEGTARAEVDREALLSAIQKKQDLTAREKEEIQMLLSDAEKDLSLLPDGGLSNGDTVTVKSALNEKLLKAYGVILKNGSLEKKTEGLMEMQEISLNDFLSFYFSGFEGHGNSYASIDYDGLFQQAAEQIRAVDPSQEAENFITEKLGEYLYSISIEPYSGETLSNGDEIKVTISMEKPEIPEYGLRFVWQEAVSTVEGLAPVETVSLTDYLEFAAEGYNGGGYGSVRLNREALEADLKELFEKDKRNAYGALTEDTDPGDSVSYAADVVEGCWNSDFNTTADKQEGLFNQDRVKVASTWDQEDHTYYIEAVGICLKGGEKEFTVEGLKEPQEVDLAEALEVEFSGTYPFVTVKRTIDYELPYVYDTSLGEMSSWEEIEAKEGDVYSGNIEYDEAAMLRNGYKVINHEYSYTITGLDSSILSLETGEDEALLPTVQKMQERAKSEIADSYEWILEEAGADKGWIVWENVQVELEFAEVAYQELGRWSGSNLYLIFKGALPVKDRKRQTEQRDVYCVAFCGDVTENPAGELRYEEEDIWLALNREQMEELLKSRIEDMGSNVERRTLPGKEEAQNLTAELTGNEPVRGMELPKKAQPGQIPENAAKQAAKILTYNGHTYARYDLGELDWMLAEQFCEAAGGHLATITSRTEQEIVEKLLEDGPLGTYWLGASDASFEGSWQWVTGETFAYQRWRDGQPDNAEYGEDSTGEDYLEVGQTYGYEWNDRELQYTDNGFILEVEPERAGITGRELSELVPKSSYNSGYQEYVQDTYGNDHFGSLYLDASEGGVLNYDLNGAWGSFTGNVSTWGKADSEAVFDLMIWGDDRLLYSAYGYEKTDAPLEFHLDVTGVSVLSIQSRNWGSYSNGYLFVNEACLLPAETAAGEGETKTVLTELPLIDSREYQSFDDTGVRTDSDGNSHRSWQTFYAQEGGYGVWNLEGNYTAFAGVICTDPKAYSVDTAVNVEILLDGEQVFLAEDYTVYQGAIPVSLDVTGKQTLEVRTWQRGEYQDGTICMADALLLSGKAENTEKEKPEEAAGEAVTEQELTEEEALEASDDQKEAEGEGTLFQLQFPEIPELIERQAARVLTYGNFRYYRFEEAMSWQQARSFCRAAGGKLACPTDAVKNGAVARVISGGIHQSYWLGGQFTGKDWIWEDQEPFSYTNWKENQPDNWGGLEYLMEMDQDGRWNDVEEEARMGFVMEVEASAGQLPEDGVSITDLEWLEEYRTGIVSITDLQGQEHINSVELCASDRSGFSVNLEGRYKTFRGNVTPYSRASDNVSFSVAVFGDGQPLFSLTDFRKNRKAEQFEVDVTGVKVLTVRTCNDGSYDNGYLYLNEARLVSAQEPAEAKNSRLGELIFVDGVNSETRSGLQTDSFGRLHDGWIAVNGGEGASLLYNLDGECTFFSGSFVSAQDTVRDHPVKISIYLDQELACEIENFEKMAGTEKITLDLTDKEVMEIVAEPVGDTRENWIYLTDDLVKRK